MTTPTEGPPESKLPRRSIRLSVRALMVVVVFLALGLGWVVQRARVQREAVAAIVKTGGQVVYEWGRIPGGGLNPNGQPRGPKWLVERLGVDYFGSVVIAQLGPKGTDAEMEHIGRLSRLQGAMLSRAKGVTDAGVAHLRGLVDLDHIGLGGTKATGTCLANFRGMTRLKELSLAGVPVADADLAHLEGLTSLEFLDLYSTPVTDAGLSHLEGLVNLKSLRLTSTQVTGPGLSHLGGMTRLSSLMLARTKVEDLSSLPPLPGLKSLILDEAPVDDSRLASLSRLTSSLEILSLRRTGVTDAGLVDVPRWKESLKSLGLGGSKVTDASLPVFLKLENLRTLLLEETRVSDATIDQLSALKGLRSLDVSKAAVTDAGLARLRKALPQLKMAKEVADAATARARAARARAASIASPSKPGPQP